MTTDERLQKFDKHCEHLLGAARLCLKHKYIVPAMMLTFAAIDGMAWLYMDHDEPSRGEDFKAWVDRFMIAHLSSGTITSTDLWANRNALLHEQSSNSQLTRRGEAKPFLYQCADGQAAFPLTAQWRVAPLIIRADALVDAFEKAIERFRRFIETSNRPEQILNRCLELFNTDGIVVAE